MLILNRYIWSHLKGREISMIESVIPRVPNVTRNFPDVHIDGLKGQEAWKVLHEAGIYDHEVISWLLHKPANSRIKCHYIALARKLSAREAASKTPAIKIPSKEMYRFDW